MILILDELKLKLLKIDLEDNIIEWFDLNREVKDIIEKGSIKSDYLRFEIRKEHLFIYYIMNPTIFKISFPKKEYHLNIDQLLEKKKHITILIRGQLFFIAQEFLSIRIGNLGFFK